MCSYVGYPAVIESDNGSSFTSWEFTTWCQSNGIKSLPYHPQSNGVAERYVQEVKLLMKRQLQRYDTVDWNEKIKLIQRDLRFTNSPNFQGKSPAQLIYSYYPRTTFNAWHKQVKDESSRQ